MKKIYGYDVTENETYEKSTGETNAQTYILDGEKYQYKNHLVLAVVQKYYMEHPDISAGKLMMVFDKSLQGSLGVIRKLEDVSSRYKDYELRFFCKPKDVIHIDRDLYVVCNQWDKNNIGNILMKAKELGYTVEETV